MQRDLFTGNGRKVDVSESAVHRPQICNLATEGTNRENRARYVMVNPTVITREINLVMWMVEEARRLIIATL